MNLKKVFKITMISIFLLTSFNNYVFSDDMVEDQIIDVKVFNHTSKSNYVAIAPKIGSKAAIVVDTVTGRVLYEKGAYSIRPMASTTKIMTAILALERGNMNDIVIVSSRASQIRGSSAHLVKGENIRLEELLYGLMLPSGNDAAIAIAEHIGGSVENFALMMTQKAKDIGAINTSFKTPHGLDKEGHYTTAYDMALITRYALKNKKFCEIVSTYKTVISAPNNKTRVLRNTNEMLSGYSGADGVKTGYTGKAGRCLVTSATRDNWRLISVVLGSNSRYQRAGDSTKILNYVFNNYKIRDLNSIIRINTSIPIIKGKEANFKISSNKSIYYPLRKDEVDQLRIRYDLPSYVTAPLKEGSKLGTVIYSVGVADCKKIDVFVARNVAQKNVIDYSREIFTEWLETFRNRINKAIL